ncbi:MAG: cobalt-zinc-cadmium resistance protein [Gallionella sp.]|nr:cobalt-zinc-cadmium resistance protein [Gallionella sp.]
MRRFLILLLMVMLPLNAAFAAAASYCQHQKESLQAVHFGHHTHQHDRSTDKAGDAGAQVDPDCEFCHLSYSSFVPTLSLVPGDDAPSQLVAPAVAEFRSATVDPFDRPPLARLA